jgi:hypothetical protein
LLGKAPGLGCRVAAAVVSEPFNGLGRLCVGPNLFSTACIIKSPTKAASMPLVVATQLMISLSQQSSANATRTFSPLAHDSSTAPEWALLKT